jgi:hypothetical protein
MLKEMLKEMLKKAQRKDNAGRLPALSGRANPARCYLVPLLFAVPLFFAATLLFAAATSSNTNLCCPRLLCRSASGARFSQ